MPSNKPSVLIFSDWFYPGYKAGGPIQSVVNFTEMLEQDLNISILTADRDLGETIPYPIALNDGWQSYNQSQVQYLPTSKQTYHFYKQIIQFLQPDVIYFNSMFSPKFTLIPLTYFLFNKPQCKLILSPRGMLRSSALAIKSRKKKVFLQLFKLLGIPKKLTFLATDEAEKKDLTMIFGKKIKVVQISNLPPKASKTISPILKKEKHIKLVFIGRVHPIKNLDYLLNLLENIKYFQITLSIYGIYEDLDYLKKCKKIVQTFSSNIEANFYGEVIHSEIAKIIQQHHFLVLPTLGENFGHAIFEAFAAGCPVIISDQTPWRDLEEKKIGWDISLNQPEQFIKAIKTAAAMKQDEYNVWANAAWQYAKDFIQTSNLKEKYLKLFS